MLLLVFVILAMTPKAEPFSISIRCDERTEYIEAWRDANGNLFIFLPGYVQMQDMTFHLNTDTEVSINGKPVQENMDGGDFICDVPYDMQYTVFGTKQRTQLTFVQSGGVATMFLSTETGSMEYIHETKGNEESGMARLYEEDGKLDCSVEDLTVKGRGNATWTDSEKKAYTVTVAQQTDLLGMGEASKWVLLSNAADHSHIRNKLVYDFAAEIGLPYSPDTRWVDLYLNGEYAGLYLLSEKIEVHPERVDMASDQSFLVSVELPDRLETQGLPYVKTTGGQALRIHYPDNVDQATQSKLAAQWQSIENAILSEDGMDPVSGQYFWEMADLRSWTLNYLIDEMFGNLDCFKASRYFYMGQDGKIYAGPVWDYDKSLGNDTVQYWSITNPRVQIAYRYAYDPQSAHFWAERLYEQSWFRESIKITFETEMLVAAETLIDAKIEEYANQIRSAALMDRVRWLSTAEGSFDEAVDQVAAYLEEHTQYLQEIWVEEKRYCQVSVLKIGCDQFYTVPKGDCLEEELPDIKKLGGKTFAGWYYCDTNEPFDITQPITEDIQIYAKWEDSAVQKVKQLVNVFPLGVLAVIGLVFVAVDWRKNKKSGSALK